MISVSSLWPLGLAAASAFLVTLAVTPVVRRVAVAWEDDRAGSEGIYLRVRAADGGWGPETRVSPVTPKNAYRLPQLLWRADGALELAWEVWDHAAGPTGVAKRLDGRTIRP